MRDRLWAVLSILFVCVIAGAAFVAKAAIHGSIFSPPPPPPSPTSLLFAQKWGGGLNVHNVWVRGTGVHLVTPDGHGVYAWGTADNHWHQLMTNVAFTSPNPGGLPAAACDPLLTPGSCYGIFPGPGAQGLKQNNAYFAGAIYTCGSADTTGLASGDTQAYTFWGGPLQAPTSAGALILVTSNLNLSHPDTMTWINTQQLPGGGFTPTGDKANDGAPRLNGPLMFCDDHNRNHFMVGVQCTGPAACSGSTLPELFETKDGGSTFTTVPHTDVPQAQYLGGSNGYLFASDYSAGTATVSGSTNPVSKVICIHDGSDSSSPGSQFGGVYCSVSGGATGTWGRIGQVALPNSSITVGSSGTGATVTVTTSSPHGIPVGIATQAVIAGATSAYNGFQTIKATTSTQFTYTLGSAPNLANIASGTYDNVTGNVSLTLKSAITGTSGDSITLSAVKGGSPVVSLPGLNGTFTSTSISGTTVTFTAPSGLGYTTITSGVVTDNTGITPGNWSMSFQLHNVVFGEGDHTLYLIDNNTGFLWSCVVTSLSSCPAWTLTLSSPGFNWVASDPTTPSRMAIMTNGGQLQTCTASCQNTSSWSAAYYYTLANGDAGWWVSAQTNSIGYNFQFDTTNAGGMSGTLGQQNFVTTFPTGPPGGISKPNFVWTAQSIGIMHGADGAVALWGPNQFMYGGQDNGNCLLTLTALPPTSCGPLQSFGGLKWVPGMYTVPEGGLALMKGGNDSGAGIDISGYSNDGFNSDYHAWNRWEIIVPASALCGSNGNCAGGDTPQGHVRVDTSKATFGPTTTSALTSWVNGQGDLMCSRVTSPASGTGLYTNGVQLCYQTTVIDSTHFDLIGAEYEQANIVLSPGYAFFVGTPPLTDQDERNNIASVQNDGSGHIQVCLFQATTMAANTLVSVTGVVDDINGINSVANGNWTALNPAFKTSQCFTLGPVSSSAGLGNYVSGGTLRSIAQIGGTVAGTGNDRVEAPANLDTPRCSADSGKTWSDITSQAILDDVLTTVTGGSTGGSTRLVVNNPSAIPGTVSIIHVVMDDGRLMYAGIEGNLNVSGTYNNTSGAVTLTIKSPSPPTGGISGDQITLTNMKNGGTNLTALNGTFTTSTISSDGITVTFTAPPGLGSSYSTITSGQLNISSAVPLSFTPQTTLPLVRYSVPITRNVTASTNQIVFSGKVQSGGSGGTNGQVTLTVVGGTGTAATLNGTISGGVLTSVDSVITPGSYTVFPTNPVSVTGGGLSGATVNLLHTHVGDILNSDHGWNTSDFNNQHIVVAEVGGRFYMVNYKYGLLTWTHCGATTQSNSYGVRQSGSWQNSGGTSATLVAVGSEQGHLFYTDGYLAGSIYSGQLQHICNGVNTNADNGSHTNGIVFSPVPNTYAAMFVDTGAPKPGKAYPAIYYAGWYDVTGKNSEANSIFGFWVSTDDPNHGNTGASARCINNTASFTGYISGTDLFITSGSAGSMSPGDGILSPGPGTAVVATGTQIVSGGGTHWIVNNSQNVGNSGSPVALTAGGTFQSIGDWPAAFANAPKWTQPPSGIAADKVNFGVIGVQTNAGPAYLVTQ